MAKSLTMRPRLFTTWVALRWILLVLIAAQGLEAPGIAQTSERPLPPKPIRTWVGVGSWYGADFQGRPTANGEIYDMYGATAAHLTLPLGSVVRVTCLRTGRSRVVRINDRGPYIEGREIDVSYEVARWLGFEENGLARVRLELLEAPEKRWPQPLAHPQTHGAD